MPGVMVISTISVVISDALVEFILNIPIINIQELQTEPHQYHTIRMSWIKLMLQLGRDVRDSTCRPEIGDRACYEESRVLSGAVGCESGIRAIHWCCNVEEVGAELRRAPGVPLSDIPPTCSLGIVSICFLVACARKLTNSWGLR